MNFTVGSDVKRTCMGRYDTGSSKNVKANGRVLFSHGFHAPSFCSSEYKDIKRTARRCRGGMNVPEEEKGKGKRQ